MAFYFGHSCIQVADGVVRAQGFQVDLLNQKHAQIESKMSSHSSMFK